MLKGIRSNALRNRDMLCLQESFLSYLKEINKKITLCWCVHQSVCRIRGSILHQSDCFISVCIKHQSDCHIGVCISQQSDCCLKVCVLHQSCHSIWISCTNHSISVLLSCKYVMESGDNFVWHKRLSQV